MQKYLSGNQPQFICVAEPQVAHKEMTCVVKQRFSGKSRDTVRLMHQHGIRQLLSLKRKIIRVRNHMTPDLRF